jgi:hypothetical protein
MPGILMRRVWRNYLNRIERGVSRTDTRTDGVSVCLIEAIAKKALSGAKCPVRLPGVGIDFDCAGD